jgi:hypothetical protein
MSLSVVHGAPVCDNNPDNNHGGRRRILADAKPHDARICVTSVDAEIRR